MLSDQDADVLRAGTFSRYRTAIPAFGEVLDGKITVPAAARRTWLWPGTAQACPECLALTGGLWMLAWRLPWTFCCPAHNRYLITHCPRCRHLLREHHRCPRRCADIAYPDEWDVLCGGPADRMAHSLQAAEATAAAVIDAALTATTPDAVHATLASSQAEYLDTLRSLAGTYLHLDQRHSHLAGQARRAVAAPPRDPVRRGQLLTRAVSLLALPRDVAIDRFSEELAHLHAPEGLGPWLRDHTTRTPLIDALIEATTRKRSSIGRHRITCLDLDPKHIPQLIWPSTWLSLHKMLDTSESTGRTFASMLLVKTMGRTTWQSAGAALGLPETLASNIARTGVRGLTTGPPTFIKALTDSTRKQLHPTVNYRRREQRAVTIGNSRPALDQLRGHLQRPRLRDSLLRERIWTQWAMGHPALAPTRSGTKQERAGAANQRRRWTPDTTAQLTQWCNANHGEDQT